MAPQLYITMYKEQFSSPGRVKRTELRPSSAHRRNNPQPKPDFLFPRSVQYSYRSSCTLPQPSPPVHSDRPALLPPVKHLSFQSPVSAVPNSCVDMDKHMPSINPSTGHSLPPADVLQTLQAAEPLPTVTVRNPPRKVTLLRCPQIDYQRNVHRSSQQLRQHQGAQARPQTGLPAAQRHCPPTQYQRSASITNLDSSGCYSCFQVVKPYQVGHYIIHPEFVSECLR